MAKKEKEKDSLSDEAKVMLRNLRDKGKLITKNKEAMIEVYADFASGVADEAVKKSGLTNIEERSALWNSVYHPYIDKSLKEHGLRK